MSALLKRLQALRMLILDVDGTLTDGRIGIDETQNHLKHFSIQDGIAIRSLREEGLQVGLISHSTREKAIQERAQMLYIAHCYVGKAPKEEILQTWCQQARISLEQVAAIGDDINDIPMFRCCGHSACPSDASPLVQKEADIVLARRGGHGCLREWIEDYFLVAKHW